MLPCSSTTVNSLRAKAIAACPLSRCPNNHDAALRAVAAVAARRAAASAASAVEASAPAVTHIAAAAASAARSCADDGRNGLRPQLLAGPTCATVRADEAAAASAAL